MVLSRPRLELTGSSAGPVRFRLASTMTLPAAAPGAAARGTLSAWAPAAGCGGATCPAVLLVHASVEVGDAAASAAAAAAAACRCLAPVAAAVTPADAALPARRCAGSCDPFPPPGMRALRRAGWTCSTLTIRRSLPTRVRASSMTSRPGRRSAAAMSGHQPWASTLPC